MVSVTVLELSLGHPGVCFGFCWVLGGDDRGFLLGFLYIYIIWLVKMSLVMNIFIQKLMRI